MNCKEAKKTYSIIDFLSKKNIHPQKCTKTDYWYLSPIRETPEKDCSFKVNLQLGLWRDFGTGQYGNIIDLIKLMYKCDVSEALKILSENVPSNLNMINVDKVQPSVKNSNSITITSILDISDNKLINYIQSRKVNIHDVKRLAKEIHYTTNNIQFLGLGLPTISNGWEINNPNGIKNSTSPKDISWFKFNKTEIALVEGMFDMFSLFIHNLTLANECDFMCLNSVSFKEKAAKLLAESQYHRIHLFFDNDGGGNSAVECFMGLAANLSIPLVNHSHTYKESNDLNDHVRGIKILDKKQENTIPLIIPPTTEKRNRGLSM